MEYFTVGRNRSMFLDNVRRKRVQAAKYMLTLFGLCIVAGSSVYFFGG